MSDFAKKALRYIEELKEEYPEFQPIEIEMIEETQHPDIADQYDYYYVPTFYSGWCESTRSRNFQK